MRRKNGFTIIEAVIFILIASVGFLVLSASYTAVLENSAAGESLSVATALCEGKMEEILGTHAFATIPAIVQTAFAAPFDDYDYQVVWYYVNPPNLTADAGAPTAYKIVQVIVDHPCIEPIRLTTLLADY
ncbi:MAG: type IV pilus modification PilV family protein [bacterium]